MFFTFTLMSIHSEFVTHICQMTGDTYSSVNSDLKPAVLTLAQANAYGFQSIEEYEDAIREYVYG